MGKPNKPFAALIFIVLIGLGFLGSSMKNFSGNDTTKQKNPNIIFILTDQQHANMMSCAGNKWLKTPAMDYIAENGVRFTRAYTANPVCSPARVSFMTGRFPGQFQDNNGNTVRENEGSMKIPPVSKDILNSSISSYLQKAGYDLAFGGKEHLPGSLTPKALGFNDICNDERDKLAEIASEYIKEDHEKPYFLVVSLINPHDICYMAIRDFTQSERQKRLVANAATELETLNKAQKLPEGASKEEFYEKYCPEIPDNFEPQLDEPEAINWLLESRSFRKDARDKYTDKDWRMHRWAYCRLTEDVDGQVQVILDAIKESGQEENTLVIFSSDHGDMDASHRMEHKTALYEEAANIPFMMMWKGKIKAGEVDSTHLVSNGLDLLPTVCDYAGIKGKSDPRGRSLRPLLEGGNIDWRHTLGVESEIGRMVVNDEGLKYIKYDAVGIEEQLLDLEKDPKETRQFAKEPEYQTKLNDMRKIFCETWFPGY